MLLCRNTLIGAAPSSAFIEGSLTDPRAKGTTRYEEAVRFCHPRFVVRLHKGGNFPAFEAPIYGVTSGFRSPAKIVKELLNHEPESHREVCFDIEVWNANLSPSLVAGLAARGL